MSKPKIGVTMGDPSGVGPELCILALQNRDIQTTCSCIVFGDLHRLELARNTLLEAQRIPESFPSFHPASSLNEANFSNDVINVVDVSSSAASIEWGRLYKEGGLASFEYLKQAIIWAMEGQIDAISTAPINKEAWKLAGIPYPGHTEALKSLTQAETSAMMLTNKKLRVIHVTTHVSLKDAIGLINENMISGKILLASNSLQSFGFPSPKIAVAGLNPHAGEGGLFGFEEMKHIEPAIHRARDMGVDVTGPLPPDSVFWRAATGEFDAVIAMYHDQGHIPIKMLGFDTGINVTLGLPIIRTSVDHGTAFDIAGKGVVREDSMIEAIKVAASYSQSLAYKNFSQ